MVKTPSFKRLILRAVLRQVSPMVIRILREFERHSGLLRDLAGCFVDYRDPRFIEHSVQELVNQRVYGLILGYEELNDHDYLRRDPVHGLICGKSDPSPSSLPQNILVKFQQSYVKSLQRQAICLPCDLSWLPASSPTGGSSC